MSVWNKDIVKRGIDEGRVAHTDATVLSTNKPIWNALALDVITSVFCDIGVATNFKARGAGVQRAVEGLNLSGPELKLARVVVVVTAEGYFGRPVGKHVQNLAVRDVADLVILKDRFTALVTRHIRNSDFIVIRTLWDTSDGEAVARSVHLADVAIDSAPAVFTFALLAFFSLASFLAVSERVAFWKS